MALTSASEITMTNRLCALFVIVSHFRDPWNKVKVRGYKFTMGPCRLWVTNRRTQRDPPCPVCSRGTFPLECEEAKWHKNTNLSHHITSTDTHHNIRDALHQYKRSWGQWVIAAKTHIFQVTLKTIPFKTSAAMLTATHSISVPTTAFDYTEERSKTLNSYVDNRHTEPPPTLSHLLDAFTWADLFLPLFSTARCRSRCARFVCPRKVAWQLLWKPSPSLSVISIQRHCRLLGVTFRYCYH